VIGMKREKQDVVAPLLATVLHMIVTRNVTQQTQKILSLWRSMSCRPIFTKSCPMAQTFTVRWTFLYVGFQNLVQLEETYGKEVSRAIFSVVCATKAIFNPSNQNPQDFLRTISVANISNTSQNRGFRR
jgi:type IV secretory pathway TraG/TraD family ATPase VirD4